MTPEQAKALREPFPREVIGQLPKIYCRQCSEANKARGGTCEKHVKAKCRVCRNNITDAHLHLDYVGHAETTDRFLKVDPEWTWEPVAFAPNGLPQLDENGGLWIRLTIAGVTRLGYGDAQGKRGSDAVKETIGDALRNAGLRFGVAIDLWGATFKGRDDEEDAGEVHGRDADAWEDAQPAKPQMPNRDQLIERGHQAIRDAATVETLNKLRDRVDRFALDNQITTDDAASMHAAINGREVELKGNTGEAPAAAKVTPLNEKRKARMFALFAELGYDDKDEQIALIQQVTGRTIQSRNEVTNEDAYNIIGALESQKRIGAGKTNGRHLSAVGGAS
jgi:hypothetical protein